MMQKGLIHNFCISNSGIIKIREPSGLTPFSLTHENDLTLLLIFDHRLNFRILLSFSHSFSWVIFFKTL